MKPQTYLFLVLLLLIFFFLAGFRSGQYVEKQNKINSIILSLTPPPTKTPTPTPTISYQEYQSRKYQLKLIFPKGLKVNESTKEAVIEIKK